MADVRAGQWNSKSDITSGMTGGLPLTVFDKAMENTVVISPFSQFMAASSHLDTSIDPKVLQMGVFGKADKVAVTVCICAYASIAMYVHVLQIVIYLVISV